MMTEGNYGDESSEGRSITHENAMGETLDAVFGALANERRRQMLCALADAESRPINAFEPVGGTAGSDAAERVRLAMFHVHLPKLADGGFIQWNEETGEVAPGPAFDVLDPYLDIVSEIQSADDDA